MPISVFAVKSASSKPLLKASHEDDFSDIHVDASESLSLETLVDEETEDDDQETILTAVDDDADEDFPESVEAGNFSAEVRKLAERFFGEVSIMSQIRRGEAYIEVSPARSPALRNSRGFGIALQKLGLVSEWDGDDKVFKVKVAASSTEASLDTSTQSELLYDLLTSFFGVIPEPSDEQIHHLALAIGMEPEELEAELYRLMSVMFNDDAGEEATELAESLEETDEVEDEDEDEDGEEEEVEADVAPYTPAEGEPDGAPDQSVVDQRTNTPTN